MGAKFKAPLDSRCFAEMEEQHFRLPLPPYVCLCFALLSFPASFIPSLLYVFIPLSSPLTLSRLNSFSSTSSPPLPRLLLLFHFQYLIRGYIRSSAASLFSRSPSLYLNPAFITYASLSNLTDIDQCAAAGLLSWCKFVQRAPSITLDIQTEP